MGCPEKFSTGVFTQALLGAALSFCCGASTFSPIEQAVGKPISSLIVYMFGTKEHLSKLSEHLLSNTTPPKGIT